MTLPTPAAAFRWTTEPWGAALRCDPLSAMTQHVFTSRQLRLRITGDARSAEWDALARAVGAGAGRVARIRQVHSNGVRVLERGRSGEEWRRVVAERPEADAIVSGEPGLALAIQVADCVPILLADAGTGAVAAVHAGWRGTCAHVARATVAAMTRTYGTRPEDLTAALGPSIGPCCYEVGAELLERFEDARHAPDAVARWFARIIDEASGPGGSLRLDVARANRDQLVAAGVRPDRIFACGLCTKCHADVFDSFRAAGAAAGRMVAVIASERGTGNGERERGTGTGKGRGER